MAIALNKNNTLNDHIKQLVEQAFCYVRRQRECPEITDFDFTFLCLWRVLSQVKTGRDFIQSMSDQNPEQEYTSSTYFDALSSSRRGAMFEEATGSINAIIEQELLDQEIDHLGYFPELKGRTIVAGDGHAIEHACHAKRQKNGKYAADSSLYLLDLHAGLMTFLSNVQGNGSRAHEMPVLRQALPVWQRGLRKNEKPPILIFDRAAVDKVFWSRMAMAKENGIRIITRTKDNMRFAMEAPLHFDPSLSVNIGVVGVDLVGQDGALAMRRIRYINPEDNMEYEFYTSVDDLEPGVIAWLYLLRWKIEKNFDVFKNKLHEKKSWATSSTSQEIQARSCATAYNILILLHHLFSEELEIHSNKVERKRESDIERRQKQAEEKGRSIHPLERSKLHIFQLTQQFIRAVRNLIFSPRSLGDTLPIFKRRLEFYL